MSGIQLITKPGMRIIDAPEYTAKTYTDNLGYDSNSNFILIPYETTKVYNGKITLIIDEPMSFPNEKFHLKVGGMYMNLYMDTVDNKMSFNDTPSSLRLGALTNSDFFNENPQYKNPDYVRPDQYESYTLPEKDDVDEKHWDAIADFILEYLPDVDVRQFLLDDGFTEKFIDPFLEQYPDLEKSN